MRLDQTDTRLDGLEGDARAVHALGGGHSCYSSAARAAPGDRQVRRVIERFRFPRGALRAFSSPSRG